MDTLSKIHDHLVSLGHDVGSVRKLRSGVLEVVMRSGDGGAALAAAKAWAPSAKDKAEAAARKRGLSVLQLATARAQLALEQGVPIPSWAGNVLSAELGGVDAEIA